MAAGIVRRSLVRLKMRFEVRHVSGPLNPELAADDVAACITIKDGAQYLPSFLDYHRKLGLRHFFFLDNGSTDGTLEMLRAAPDVTVVASAITYKRNDAVFAKYLVDRFARGCWSLTLDIDEYFDYPRSDKIPLKGLLAYLRAHGYDAMITQMLDMYRLIYRPGDDEAFHRRAHDHYETASIEKLDYPAYYKSVCDNPAVKSHWGGVRARVFGFRPCLTKHALLYRDKADRCADNNHFVKDARVADITGVLYHYKFISGFAGLVEEGVRLGHYHNNSAAHRRYLEVLGGAEAVNFEGPDSRRLQSVEELVENGFLVVPPRYEALG